MICLTYLTANKQHLVSAIEACQYDINTHSDEYTQLHKLIQAVKEKNMRRSGDHMDGLSQGNRDLVLFRSLTSRAKDEPLLASIINEVFQGLITRYHQASNEKISLAINPSRYHGKSPLRANRLKKCAGWVTVIQAASLDFCIEGMSRLVGFMVKEQFFMSTRDERKQVFSEVFKEAPYFISTGYAAQLKPSFLLKWSSPTTRQLIRSGSSSSRPCLCGLVN